MKKFVKFEFSIYDQWCHGGAPPRVTPSGGGGDTRPKINFLEAEWEDGSG